MKGFTSIILPFLTGLVISLLSYYPCRSFSIPKKLNSKSFEIFAGKGFGDKKNEAPAIEVNPTRSSEYKEVAGSYARLLARHSDVYDDIKVSREKHMKHDVYARLDGNAEFWFIGKFAYLESMGIQEAYNRIEILMTEYAKSLRPIELAGPAAARATLQLWYAPGDTEMQVAQNKVKLELFSRTIEENADSTPSEVGFQAEIYSDGEMGFRCKRDDEGNPIRAAFEVQFGDSSMIPPDQR